MSFKFPLLLLILFHRTRFSRPTGTSLLINNWITVFFFNILRINHISLHWKCLKTPWIKPWIKILIKLRFKKIIVFNLEDISNFFEMCSFVFSCFLQKSDEAINISLIFVSRATGWLAKLCNNARRTVSKVQKWTHQKLDNEGYNSLSLAECAQKIIRKKNDGQV